jgi:2-(1,2-epoxy-1,2-dihydrophenyl)acetyl-CoA isomerase
MELALLPDLFDAATAQRLGLVNWVVPAAELEDADSAHRSADSRRARRSLTASQALAQSARCERSIETQMEEELQAFARCALTGDLAEGVASFVEKRKPQFKGR